MGVSAYDMAAGASEIASAAFQVLLTGDDFCGLADNKVVPLLTVMPIVATVSSSAKRQLATNRVCLSDRAHHDLFKALFDPNSADGKGFREAYY